MGSFSPGDIIINTCSISGSGGTVDISRRIRSWQIFENLQKPYTSVQMVVVDNTGLMDQNVVLDGTNTLSLSFQNPGQAPYENVWAITSVEKSSHTQNLRTKIYNITGYSLHMLNAPRVQKAYKDMTPTDVVADLVNTYLGPLKGLQIRDPSRGMIGSSLMPFNINGQQIHAAIKNVMNQSASASNDSSAYALFEDSKSMVLDSLENILVTGLANPVATYIQRPLGQDFIRDQALQAYVILNLRENARVDRTASLQAESQVTRPYDIFGHTFDSIASSFGVGAGGGGKGGSTYQNLSYNIMRPPSFAKVFAAPRKWIASVFDGQSVTIQVPFNSDLTVACGLIVDSIAPGGDLDTATLDGMAGPVVATEVCHNVRLDRKKMQGLSIVRAVTGR
jgi:hypothetical protein